MQSMFARNADVIYMIRARIDSGSRRGAPQLTKDVRVLKKAEIEIMKLREENSQLKAHIAQLVEAADLNPAQ